MSTKGKRRYIVLMCAPVRVRILKNIDIKSSCIIPKVNYNYLSLHMFYLFLCSFCNTIAYKYTSSFGSDKFIDCDFQIFFLILLVATNFLTPQVMLKLLC